MRLRRNLVVNIVVLTSFLVQVNDAQFTNQWAVDIDGGHSEADRVAKETGCANQGRPFFSTFLKLLIYVDWLKVAYFIGKYLEFLLFDINGGQ